MDDIPQPCQHFLFEIRRRDIIICAEPVTFCQCFPCLIRTYKYYGDLPRRRSRLQFLQYPETAWIGRIRSQKNNIGRFAVDLIDYIAAAFYETADISLVLEDLPQAFFRRRRSVRNQYLHSYQYYTTSEQFCRTGSIAKLLQFVG